MKAIILLTLALVLTSALKVSNTNVEFVKQELGKIQDQAWVKIITNMAELSMKAAGPMQDLVVAIEDVIEDLKDKRTRSKAKFALATANHESQVKYFNNEILSAKNNIASSTDAVNDTMMPNLKSLEGIVASTQDDIDKGEKYIVAQGLVRDGDRKDYEQRLKDYDAAIAGIDKCVEMLQNEELSMIQIDEMKVKIRKVNSHENETDNILVQTLAKLASQKMVDKDAVAQVIQLLKEVSANMLASKTKEIFLEKQAVEAYDKDMKANRTSITGWENKVDTTNATIDTVKTQIKDTQEYIADRKVDLKDHTDDLQSENDDYDKLSANFKSLQEQIDMQEAACGNALTIIKGAAFADYIEARIGKDDLMGEKAHVVESAANDATGQ